jgi:putative peptidoglycan lipid II flippase
MSRSKRLWSVGTSLNDAFGLLAFSVIPFSVGGALLSRPIVSVMFERGAFDAVDASAQVFGILLLSLFSTYAFILMLRLLLILRETRAQALLSVTLSALNAVLNGAGPLFGLIGIAISTLISRAIVLEWLMSSSEGTCRSAFPS